LIIFYNYKNLSSFFFTIFFAISVLLFSFSCGTLNIMNNMETEQIELHIKDIFQDDIIKSFEIHGYNYNSLIIYSILQEMFEKSNIYFSMTYSDDNITQDIMKEIAIIESAEKASSFVIEKYKAAFANGAETSDSAEKLFILSFATKQLLINCVKNIDPLKEEIEQVIEEKKWDMEYDEEDDYELFFDIIKLENGIFYLNKIKRTLLKNLEEVTKIADKALSYQYH